jgi:hypothetical protein
VSWRKQQRRFKRGFPLAFAILAAMAILGGILHAPNNYDGLAYRTPRVLHWLAEGRWHWVSTQFQRLNTRAAAFEWMTSPIFVLARTDRFEFIINSIPFLLLPGLVYSVFRRLGVSWRVAWYWMWLFPTGYCYLLQAGSIANDAFGAFFPLAAVYFALRAKQTGRVNDAWFSILAAALMTGSKTSNLPLLLPWAVAVFPALSLLREKIVGSVLVGVVAAACSFLPTALLNLSNGAGWDGSRAEAAAFGSAAKWAPLLRFGWNTVLLPIQNLAPPINPVASKWNRQVPSFLPPKFRKVLEEHFEPSQAHASMEELQVEESAGLGFGVSALLLAGCVIRRAGADRKPPNIPACRPRLGKMVIVAACISMAVVLTQMRWATLARLITPYYALVVPLLLLCDSQRRAINRHWWKMAGIAVFLIAGLMLVLSPARPLWPARTVLSGMQRRFPDSAMIQRAMTVYSVYGERNDAFAPALAVLPHGLQVLGLVTFDDPEASLWKPFGSRRIKHVVSTDKLEDLRKNGIEYVLLNPKKLEMLFGRAVEEWLAEMQGQVVEVIPLRLRAGQETAPWYLVRIPALTAQKRIEKSAEFSLSLKTE